MHISWLGGTTIKVQTKPAAEDVVLVIDPYKPSTGAFPRSLTPNIVLYTRGEDNTITISGNPFVLATPGECETKGVLMTALYTDHNEHLFVRFDSEGLSVAHLGLIDAMPTDKELETIGDVDILILPVGGAPGYTAESAVKVVNAIEPKIVIPVGYQSENDPKAAAVDVFLREMGAKPDKAENKVIIRKKDLPTEETKVIIIEKE